MALIVAWPPGRARQRARTETPEQTKEQTTEGNTVLVQQPPS
jgi:hypothetical protein